MCVVKITAKIELINILLVHIFSRRKGDSNPNELSREGVPLPLCSFYLKFEFNSPLFLWAKFLDFHSTYERLLVERKTWFI
jgi:hypothetical protein